MKKLQVYILISALWVLGLSCEKEGNEVVSAPEVLADVTYGSDSKQRMDVYLPASRNANTPVIVLLHGGGFVAGDKSEFSLQSQQLSGKGFVVLNVNYRLVDIDGVMSNPMVHKPSAIKIADQLNDIQAAINLAASKAGEWKMSSEKWAITGHSAGGTLAMLYAYGDRNTGKRIKAAGNWAGATTFGFSDESEIDAVDPRIAEVLYRAIGAEATNANKLAYMAASPFWIAYQGKAIATINIRPQMNAISDMPDGSEELYRQFTEVLNAKSVPYKWVEVAGADHGFSQPGKWDIVLNETVSFFKIHAQ